jgi:hypothetical protein
MIYAIQIFSVLIGIIKTFFGNLRELTATCESRNFERVDGVGVLRPVRVSRFISTCWLSIIIESFIVTVPAIAFNGEAIGCVNSTLVMSVNLMKVSSQLNMV